MAEGKPQEPTRPCPICAKPPSSDYAPFCSKRCADVDLHRWLGGVYVVPGEDADEVDMPPQGRPPQGRDEME